MANFAVYVSICISFVAIFVVAAARLAILRRQRRQALAECELQLREDEHAADKFWAVAVRFQW